MTTTLESLGKARNEKGPMSARNKSVTVSFNPADLDIESAILRGITRNADEFLNPPIANLGYKGIKKTGTQVRNWYSMSSDLKNDFSFTALMMEQAGTGGALFRNLYRDFLKESYQLLGLNSLKEGHERFVVIAAKWKEVSDLFRQVAGTGLEDPLIAASALLEELSELERIAVQNLSDAITDQVRGGCKNTEFKNRQGD